MNTTSTVRLLLFSILCATLSVLAFAQDEPSEKIQSFHSAIQIHRDGSMTVTETLEVSCALKDIRHGIYRDFPTRYKDRLRNDYSVDFMVHKILRDGAPEEYHLQPIFNGLRVYIGKKDVILTPGIHTFILTYGTDRQIGYFKDFDELYWNVTGNDWSFPIEAASANVELPVKVRKEQLRLDGYTGTRGSQEKNFSASLGPDKEVSFVTTAALKRGEGLTIVVGWPKGIVLEPSLSQKALYFLHDNRSVFTGLVGLLVILGYYILVWYHFGRDPAKGVVFPRYDPPKGLSPGAVRYLFKMGFDDKVCACAIINMAVKGYLIILEEKKGQFVLQRREAKDVVLSEEENALAAALFEGAPEAILDSFNHERIKTAFRKSQEILKKTYDKTYFLTNKQYFIPGAVLSALAIAACALSCSSKTLFPVIFLSFWLTFWSLGVAALLMGIFSAWKACLFQGSAGSPLGEAGLCMKAVFLSLFSLPFILGEAMGIMMLIFFSSFSVLILLCAAVILNILFYHLLKAPTLLGRRIMDQIDGFKMYLGVAEKERLNVLYPAGQSPELFERYLPYALALDVQQQWAQKFSFQLHGASADHAEYSPLWYRAAAGGLSAASLASALGNSFSGALSSASNPPGSSSGGGGGGSSGGGGGGGGGGGW